MISYIHNKCEFYTERVDKAMRLLYNSTDRQTDRLTDRQTDRQTWLNCALFTNMLIEACSLG